MTKLAIRAAQLPESIECTGCHCHTVNGYRLRSGSSTRFVCESCFDALYGEYPLASHVVVFPREGLAALLSEGRVGFKAGYLLGRKEEGADGCTITVTELLEAAGSRSTVAFFGPEDIRAIRQKCTGGSALVGLFRTDPSGSGEMNDLDTRTAEGLLMDVVYAVIAGGGDDQITVRDRHRAADNYGVLIP